MQRESLFFKKSLFCALFLTAFLGLSSKQAHPFYISVTEIRANTQQKSLNISCRMFTDDLQQALFRTVAYKAELENYDGKADAFLEKYLGEHLQVFADGRLLHFKWVGYEVKEESTWCYLEAIDVNSLGSVKIINRILYDYIEEQTNIVHFYRDGVRQSHKLLNPEQELYF
jgi:hypothetical protein